MPTAIVMICTREGFVVASDGRSITSGGVVTAEHEQKILPIVGPSWNLALGVSGAASLLDKTGVDCFKIVYQNVVDELKASNFTDLGEYAAAFVYLAGRQLHSLLLQERPCPLPDSITSPDTKCFVRMDFAGYFNGFPSMATRVVSFWRDKCSVTHQTTSSPARLSENSVVGSDAVTRQLLGTDTDEFSKFKTIGFQKLLKKDSSISLQEAREAAKRYIEACSTEKAREIDSYCKTIGGRISIATLTPTKGFEWVEPSCSAVIF